MSGGSGGVRLEIREGSQENGVKSGFKLKNADTIVNDILKAELVEIEGGRLEGRGGDLKIPCPISIVNPTCEVKINEVQGGTIETPKSCYNDNFETCIYGKRVRGSGDDEVLCPGKGSNLANIECDNQNLSSRLSSGHVTSSDKSG